MKKKENNQQKQRAKELEYYLNLAYEKVRNYKFILALMEDKELILSQPDEDLKRIGAMVYLLATSMYFDYETTFSAEGVSVEIKECVTPF